MYLPLHEDFSSPVISYPKTNEVSYVCEKGSGLYNEDRLLVGDGVYGVFDGATSLEAMGLTVGLTGGAMAAQIAADTFKDSGADLFDMAVEANNRIALAEVAAGVDLKRRESLWSTSMAVVRLTNGQLEFCQTGDSLIMAINSDGSHKLLTPEIDIDGETMKLWQRSAGIAEESIYSTLRQQIRKVRLQMNRQYGVLNGEPEAVSFFNHGRVSLDSVSDIILFTDGLYLPKKDPDQPTDWATFVSIYRAEGLGGLKHYVKELQRQDPNLTRFPRFKIHDDIAAVSLQLDR